MQEVSGEKRLGTPDLVDWLLRKRPVDAFLLKTKTNSITDIRHGGDIYWRYMVLQPSFGEGF